jgi:CheY-like chemotaxis protein
MIQALKRILIAEDDPSLLKAMRARLEYEGFSVVCAQDGEEALAKLSQQQPFDMAILDVKMPKLDGYEVCRRIKNQPATRGIPILIMTGTQSDAMSLANRCFEVGADDWIMKPFLTKDMVDKVKRLVFPEKEG